jgi:hypothetical protein
MAVFGWIFFTQSTLNKVFAKEPVMVPPVHLTMKNYTLHNASYTILKVSRPSRLILPDGFLAKYMDKKNHSSSGLKIECKVSNSRIFDIKLNPGFQLHKQRKKSINEGKQKVRVRFLYPFAKYYMDFKVLKAGICLKFM